MKTRKSIQYSPFFGISPTTRQFAWRTDPWDEFDIVLD